jgi:ribosomal protein L7/L12
MNTVATIIELFDDLDAYEAIDLVSLLAERGYILSIDRTREVPNPNSGRRRASLYLENYDDDKKIQTIKLVRSIKDDYENVYVSCRDFGLKEAKDYTEMSLSDRRSNPICKGSYQNILEMKQKLNKTSEDITFAIKEEI